ncbi:hypothetical protein D3C75_937230 [compost metagenome]
MRFDVRNAVRIDFRDLQSALNDFPLSLYTWCHITRFTVPVVVDRAALDDRPDVILIRKRSFQRLQHNGAGPVPEQNARGLFIKGPDMPVFGKKMTLLI